MLIVFENILLIFVVVSSVNVIFISNPVQSLLWLILTFAFSSMLFIIFGVELMSIFIFMIYIGAIAVLFLFVVMMLNIKIVELYSFYLKYFYIGIVVFCFFILEIVVSIFFEFDNYYVNFKTYIDWLSILNFNSNIFVLSSIIYNYNIFLFLMLGIILFIAMICSIILLINWNVSKIRKTHYTNIYVFNRSNIRFLK